VLTSKFYADRHNDWCSGRIRSPDNTHRIFGDSGNEWIRSGGRSNGIVISDDTEVSRTITDYLAEHCRVHGCSISNLNQLDRRFDRVQFVVLGGHNRKRVLEALVWIRSRSNVATIVVGNPGNEQECVMLLEHGADDYILQQTTLRELLARIRVVLRFDRPNSSSERCRYFFGGWQYDHDLRRLTNPQQLPVALTNGQRALLKAFLDAPGRVLTRQHLVQAISLHEHIVDRSIDVCLSRLRRKLEAGGADRDIIRSERYLGYTFTLDVERLDSSSSFPGRSRKCRPGTSIIHDCQAEDRE
jgi:two-component system, OmpR family, response regulator